MSCNAQNAIYMTKASAALITNVIYQKKHAKGSPIIVLKHSFQRYERTTKKGVVKSAMIMTTPSNIKVPIKSFTKCNEVDLEGREVYIDKKGKFTLSFNKKYPYYKRIYIH